jgi:hypothetical protein
VPVEAPSKLSVAQDYLRLALVEQKVSEAASCLAADVAYHVHGHNAFAGRFTGPDAVVHHLQAMYEATDGEAAIVKYDDWLTSAERVVALVRHRVQLPGRWVQARRLLLFEFDSAAKIQLIHIFTEDERALDAAIGTYTGGSQ